MAANAVKPISGIASPEQSVAKTSSRSFVHQGTWGASRNHSRSMSQATAGTAETARTTQGPCRPFEPVFKLAEHVFSQGWARLKAHEHGQVSHNIAPPSQTCETPGMWHLLRSTCSPCCLMPSCLKQKLDFRAPLHVGTHREAQWHRLNKQHRQHNTGTDTQAPRPIAHHHQSPTTITNHQRSV